MVGAFLRTARSSRPTPDAIDLWKRYTEEFVASHAGSAGHPDEREAGVFAVVSMPSLASRN